MALLLARVLPRPVETRAVKTGPVGMGLVVAYPRLVGSVFRLFAEVSVLRTRAVVAFLMFMALTLWATSMVLPLTARGLSTTQVGLFGLSAAAGAVGAGRAGRLADRGVAQWVTGMGLVVMVASWPLIALLDQSLWVLGVGVLAFDFGLQSVHVANQSLILRARPEAGSRLTAGYMLCYSIGSATGAITSTVLYAAAGWTWVCVAGGVVSASALVWWVATHRQEIPAAITVAETCHR
ncbi:hypothetical protein ACFQ1S_20200 [Kibdelosporangium lantanae]|uniref:MFS transporter n=1 Tax=Kibdelosporangium lantanae TaxID=1497396 RepID=A0ABW3MDB9_9PSEU